MSLRETIETAVNTVEESQEVPVVAQVETPAPVETEEQKLGRTAGRERDEHGRLLPGKAQRPEPQTETVAAVPPPKPVAPPPSSWKKDHWDSWQKIATENPPLAEYLNQREGEFAKGVSTYKQEYENVKPLAEALQPFMPTLQQNGVNPAQWITSMGNAHHRLVYGNPQEKLQMFAQLAKDYNVPLQALYDPQVQQQFLTQQMLQPQAQQPDVRTLVREQIVEAQAMTELEQFKVAKDAGGNPLYPHFDTVRDDMALLLERGRVNDLKGAYDMALRLHDDIWGKEQQAQQAAAQQAAQETQQRAVNKAKHAGGSVRSATPAQQTPTATKGIRAALEAAATTHLADGGRV